LIGKREERNPKPHSRWPPPNRCLRGSVISLGIRTKKMRITKLNVFRPFLFLILAPICTTEFFVFFQFPGSAIAFSLDILYFFNSATRVLSEEFPLNIFLGCLMELQIHIIRKLSVAKVAISNVTNIFQRGYMSGR